MPSSNKQTMRMVKFIAELRRNSYPNSESFARKLNKQSEWEVVDMSCTPRTVQRDIKILQNVYNAPIKFDPDRNGYYLTRQTWDFQLLTQSDELITYSLLGARVLEDIAPEPLRGRVRDSVDEELANNSSELLDEAFIESLIIASGVKATVDPEVFKAIFDGWRLRRPVEFSYRKPDGLETRRRLEPHIIAYHKGIWYAKGFQLDPREIRVLAVHRMADARLVANKRFEIDPKMLADTKRDGLFSFPKLTGIVLRCDPAIGFYLREHEKAKKLKITTGADGFLEVAMPPSVEHEIIRWVLGEAGKIEVLKPASLRAKIAEAGQAIAKVNG